MKKLLVLVCVLMAGCAAPTGIVPIGGNGQYMSSKFGGMGVWSGGQVKAELYQEASAFCAKSDKKLIPVNSTSQDYGAVSYASAEIQFRCE